jgi:hypothetical protein
MPSALEKIVDTTKDDIGIQCSVIPGLREKFHAAAVQATKEVFENRVLPAVRAGTPKLSGKNRNSIAVSFQGSYRVVMGFSLALTPSLDMDGCSSEARATRELTRKNRKARHGKVPVNDRTPAKPYIYPGNPRFVQHIPIRAKQILKRVSQS